jgi:hypothetical protein
LNPDKFVKTMPVEKELRDLVKSCLRKDELSRPDIGKIIERLKTFKDRLEEQKKNVSVKSTFVCT